MIHVKNKRTQFDFCNICEQKKKLTWDHVPPQGATQITRMDILPLFDLMTRKGEIGILPQKQFPSQNGVKYRTLCEDCNGRLKKYDIELSKFTRAIASYAKSQLILPDVYKFKVRPKKIIMSILGHLLAAKPHVENVEFDVVIREVFLKEKNPPKDISIFYWLHPYERTTIIRDFGMPSVRGLYNNIAVFQLLKFFPLAYLISDIEHYENLQNLNIFFDLDEDVEIDLTINFKDFRGEFWPEIVDEGNFLFGGSGMMQAICALPKAKT